MGWNTYMYVSVRNTRMIHDEKQNDIMIGHDDLYICWHAHLHFLWKHYDTFRSIFCQSYCHQPPPPPPPPSQPLLPVLPPRQLDSLYSVLRHSPFTYINPLIHNTIMNIYCTIVVIFKLLFLNVDMDIKFFTICMHTVAAVFDRYNVKKLICILSDYNWQIMILIFINSIYGIHLLC